MKRLILILCILALPLTVWSDDDWRPKGGPGLGLNATVTGGGVTYTLKDDFSIDVAAGSVNGTAAVPGPGTRTVTDSAGNVMSITGGRLYITKGTGANDPRITYADKPVTYTQGKLFLSKFNVASTNTQLGFGLDSTNPVAHNFMCGIYLNTGNTLTHYIDALALTQVALGSYSNSTDTYIALARGTLKNFIFYKTSGNWFLYYVPITANAGTLYPGLAIGGATAAIDTYFDFLRIPTLLWTPRPLSADDFGGTYPTLDNAVLTLTGLEAYQGATKTWGDFLSGTGTTGAGVVWDHEWEFNNALTDNPGTGKTSLTLTAGAGAASYQTDWANRATHANQFDGTAWFTNTADNQDLVQIGNTFTILAEVSFGSVASGSAQYIAGVWDNTLTADHSSWALVQRSTSSTIGLFTCDGSGAQDAIYSTGTVDAGKHYQIIMVNNAGTVSFYANGVNIGTGSLTKIPQNTTVDFSIGNRVGAGGSAVSNNTKISRVATLKGTALTPLQVMNEYKKWVATSDAGVYARFYGGPDPGANGLTNQAGAVTEGTWGSENAGESSYQAYAIRYKPTVDANPGNYDNSTSLLRRTGTWSNSGGFAVNAPVAGAEAVTNGTFNSDAGSWNNVSTGGGSIAYNAGEGNPAGSLDLVGVDASNRGWAEQQVTVANNTFHRASFESEAAVNFAIGTATRGTQYFYQTSITGAGKATFRTTSTSAYFNANRVSGTAWIDNMSIKPLTLNQLLSLVNTTGTPDVYAEVDITTCATGFQAGIALNWDSPTNPTNGDLIYLNMNDGKVYWDKCTNGTWANYTSGSGGTGLTGGSKLAVRKIGTSTYIWYNNAYINSYTTVNNPATTTPTYHGMFQTGSGATETKLDNWKCYGVGSNGEYSILNSFIN